MGDVSSLEGKVQRIHEADPAEPKRAGAFFGRRRSGAWLSFCGFGSPQRV